MAGALLGLLLALAAAGRCEAAPGQTAGAEPVQERGRVRVGAPAPNFQLYDLTGRLVTLSDYRGRVVLLNFWATWCEPCRVEMPAMEELYRLFNRRDFEILAVSVDQQGAAVTRPFIEEMGLTFPILHDADMRVGVAYGARTLPMTFLVNRQGVITRQYFGALDWQSPEGRQLIKKLVAAP